MKSWGGRREVGGWVPWWVGELVGGWVRGRDGLGFLAQAIQHFGTLESQHPSWQLGYPVKGSGGFVD